LAPTTITTTPSGPKLIKFVFSDELGDIFAAQINYKERFTIDFDNEQNLYIMEKLTAPSKYGGLFSNPWSINEGVGTLMYFQVGGNDAYPVIENNEKILGYFTDNENNFKSFEEGDLFIGSPQVKWYEYAYSRGPGIEVEEDQFNIIISKQNGDEIPHTLSDLVNNTITIMPA
jgi:hypothetical protein